MEIMSAMEIRTYMSDTTCLLSMTIYGGIYKGRRYACTKDREATVRGEYKDSWNLSVIAAILARRVWSFYEHYV